jgi:hypothetical protein
MEILIQFLKINGKIISFVRQDENIYIAIKPICDALKVEYTSAFKSIKEDTILHNKIAKIAMMIPGDFQPRKYICIPEKYIYRWLFRLRSRNTFINEYREKCYYLLFNHFHGSLTDRKNVLIEKAEMKSKRQIIEESLKELDEKLINSQLSINFLS